MNVVFADDINDVVIHSLFGDGCAALAIGASQVQEKLEPGKVVSAVVSVSCSTTPKTVSCLASITTASPASCRRVSPAAISAGRTAVTEMQGPLDYRYPISISATHPGGL